MSGQFGVIGCSDNIHGKIQWFGVLRTIIGNVKQVIQSLVRSHNTTYQIQSIILVNDIKVDTTDQCMLYS